MLLLMGHLVMENGSTKLQHTVNLSISFVIDVCHMSEGTTRYKQLHFQLSVFFIELSKAKNVHLFFGTAENSLAFISHLYFIDMLHVITAHCEFLQTAWLSS